MGAHITHVVVTGRGKGQGGGQGEQQRQHNFSAQSHTWESLGGASRSRMV